MNLTLKEIIKTTKGQLINYNKINNISSVSINTRTIKKNALFIAIRGTKFDGHTFIDTAYKKSAICTIISQKQLTKIKSSHQNLIVVKDTIKAYQKLAEHYFKKLKIKTIAITGSIGKTSVKDLIAHILKNKFKIIATEKNYNNYLGVPLTIFKIKGNENYCILEMGINMPNELKVLTQMVKPHIAVITNIGHTHLMYLKNIQGVLKTKWNITKHLTKHNTLVINGDDKLLKNKTHIKHSFNIKTFGLKPYNNYICQKKSSDFHHQVFEIKDKKAKTNYTIKTNLLMNIYNYACAFCVCKLTGLTGKYIANRMSSYRQSSNMRLEKINYKGMKIINDTYNANPESMIEGLKILNNIKTKYNKIAVLGDMLELGKSSKALHKMIGEFLVKTNINYTFCIGKDFKHAYQQAIKLGFDKTKIFWYISKKDLIKKLKQFIHKNDIIYFKASRKIALETIIYDI